MSLIGTTSPDRHIHPISTTSPDHHIHPISTTSPDHHIHPISTTSPDQYHIHPSTPTANSSPLGDLARMQTTDIKSHPTRKRGADTTINPPVITPWCYSFTNYEYTHWEDWR